MNLFLLFTRMVSYFIFHIICLCLYHFYIVYKYIYLFINFKYKFFVIIIFLGRPYSIRAYRPLYRSGFKRMMTDSRFSASMCIATSKFLINSETKKIREYEDEINILVNILSGQHEGEGVKGRGNRQELERRIETVVSLIRESNDKCNRWQMDGRVCKNLLKSIKTTK